VLCRYIAQVFPGLIFLRLLLLLLLLLLLFYYYCYNWARGRLRLRIDCDSVTHNSILRSLLQPPPPSPASSARQHFLNPITYRRNVTLMHYVSNISINRFGHKFSRRHTFPQIHYFMSFFIYHHHHRCLMPLSTDWHSAWYL